MLIRIISGFFISMVVLLSSAKADIHGKADLGIIGVNMEILDSGKCVKKMDMIGINGNATVLVWDGLCLKPCFLAATGDGDIANVGLGLGYYLPLIEWFSITPSVGITYGIVDTTVDLPLFGLIAVKERYLSLTPYVGIDACLTINPKWTITAMIQYGWSTSQTEIGKFFSQQTFSSGPNYAVQVDYYLTNHWSINFALGKNSTFSKEKHGFTATGARIGMGYFF